MREMQDSGQGEGAGRQEVGNGTGPITSLRLSAARAQQPPAPQAHRQRAISQGGGDGRHRGHQGGGCREQGGKKHTGVS